MTTRSAPDEEAIVPLIIAALSRHGAIPAEPGWQAEIAPGGSTDRTFSVVDPGGTPRLTARLARPGLAGRLRHEERVLRELAIETSLAAGVANGSMTPRDPVLIDDDTLPEGRMLVHAHVPGQPRHLSDASPAARERLGACLAWVHRHWRPGYTIWPSLETRQGTRADLYRDRLASLRRYLAAGDAGHAALIDGLSLVELPASAGWQEREFALCHGDLSLGNILWEGDEPGLIDWEFARDGDPAEDIAYLVSEQQLDPALVAEIADTYIDVGGDPWAFARLSAWLPLVTLDAALWWADYWLAQGHDPAAQPDVAERLGRAQKYFGGQ
ncbi:MAG: phosphotransferase [Vicinamibacterales bacterium]